MSDERPPRPHPAAPRPVAPQPAEPRCPTVALVGFSTRLPPALVRRLQVAAPQLELRQAEIAAQAIDAWLIRHGH